MQSPINHQAFITVFRLKLFIPAPTFSQISGPDPAKILSLQILYKASLVNFFGYSHVWEFLMQDFFHV